MNVLVGYLLVLYFPVLLGCWGTNMYNGQTSSIFTSDLFTAQGQNYNISQIVNNKFEQDLAAYNQSAQIHLSLFSSLAYGIWICIHCFYHYNVFLVYGKKIWERKVAASKNNPPDIHTKLMCKYLDIHNGGSTLSCVGLWWLPLHFVGFRRKRCSYHGGAAYSLLELSLHFSLFS